MAHTQYKNYEQCLQDVPCKSGGVGGVAGHPHLARVALPRRLERSLLPKLSLADKAATSTSAFNSNASASMRIVAR